MKIKKISYCSILIIIQLIIGIEIHAENIRGLIIDEFTEEPISNVKVTLQFESPGNIKTENKEVLASGMEIFTDEKGIFSFPTLHPDGKYKFIISKPKHSTVTIEYSAQHKNGIIANPIKIKKFPPPNSVYALVNKKIIPLTMTENEKINYTKIQDNNNSGLITGGKFYIKDSDLNQIQNFKEGSIEKILFTTEITENDYKNNKYLFDPIYFHKNFVTVYEKNKPIKYLGDKNIYILGSSGILRRSYDFAKNDFTYFSADGYDQKLVVATLPSRFYKGKMAQKHKGLSPGIYAISASELGRFFFEVTNGKSQIAEIREKYNLPEPIQEENITSSESKSDDSLKSLPLITDSTESEKSLAQEHSLSLSSESKDTQPVASKQENDSKQTKYGDKKGGKDSLKDQNYKVAIQNHLKQLKYYEGPLDGIIGKETTESIIRYQKDEGLTPDGKPSLDLLSKLENNINEKSFPSKEQDNSNKNNRLSKLQSDDYEIKRLAVMQLYEKAEFNDNELETINNQLLKEYPRELSYLESDTLSWFCKILGKSRKEKYIYTLERVSSGGSTFKLRQYASYALTNLKESLSSNNTPISKPETPDNKTDFHAPDSIASRLQKLKQLRDNNLISEEEYSNKKAEIINEI